MKGYWEVPHITLLVFVEKGELVPFANYELQDNSLHLNKLTLKVYKKAMRKFTNLE